MHVACLEHEQALHTRQHMLDACTCTGAHHQRQCIGSVQACLRAQTNQMRASPSVNPKLNVVKHKAWRMQIHSGACVYMGSDRWQARCRLSQGYGSPRVSAS